MTPEQQTDFARTLVDAMKEANAASPLKRLSGWIGIIGGAIAVLVVMWQMASYLFVTPAEAAEIKQTIERDHNQDITDIIKIEQAHEGEVKLLKQRQDDAEKARDRIERRLEGHVRGHR